MPEQTGGVAGARRKGKAWIVVAGASSVFGLLSLASAAVLVVRGRWFEVVLGLGFARASYWLACGAWLRTPWAEVRELDPLPVPPPLTDRDVRRYAIAAGLAAVAVTLALGLQAIDGRWVE